MMVYLTRQTSQRIESQHLYQQQSLDHPRQISVCFHSLLDTPCLVQAVHSDKVGHCSCSNCIQGD
jgi:hypothetical protein